jgi:hypothetical protein
MFDLASLDPHYCAGCGNSTSRGMQAPKSVDEDEDDVASPAPTFFTPFGE